MTGRTEPTLIVAALLWALDRDFALTPCQWGMLVCVGMVSYFHRARTRRLDKSITAAHDTLRENGII